jgi:two-component system, chemotaxis family, protein-glutamate methylesterase/glutaminase
LFLNFKKLVSSNLPPLFAKGYAMSSVSATNAHAEQMITNVMIVDDSVVVRGLLSRWLGEEPRFKVLTSARNGRVALEEIERQTPDVIILDIEMPEMDGLTALPLIIKKLPNVAVLVASTLTRRNADISLKCLSAGAVDYIAKPDSNSGVTTSTEFRRELMMKINAIVDARLSRLGRKAARQGTSQAPASAPFAMARHHNSIPSANITFPSSYPMPKCLVIGASTGGPRAVGRVLVDAGASLSRLPVLVTQHMPPVFTNVFAEHLKVQTGREVHEARDGELIKAGAIYIAPGGRHMHLAKDANGQLVTRLGDGPAENFCRPSVDVLFRDAAQLMASHVLAVVLTGMGQDGLIGARLLTAAGCRVIVQDEATSAVWGMPGAIAKAGLAQRVLPVDQIGANIASILQEGGR